MIVCSHDLWKVKLVVIKKTGRGIIIVKEKNYFIVWDDDDAK